MANSLWKKEVLIRQTSEMSIDRAIEWTRDWLDKFQNKSSNKDENGKDIDFYFADLFDSRTGNIYRIFTKEAGEEFDMENTRFDMLITSDFIPKTSISNDMDLNADRDMLITRGGLNDIISDFIPRASIINDVGTIKKDKMKLSNTPAGGIIGGKCNIRVDNTDTYDEVDCTVDNNILTILTDVSGQYDGKACLVSYLVTSV